MDKKVIHKEMGTLVPLKRVRPAQKVVRNHAELGTVCEETGTVWLLSH